MKKSTLILTISLLFFLSANAQTERNWAVGVNYTPNVIKPVFDNKDTGTGESLLNHKFGLDVYLQVGDRLELKSGIQYSYFEFRQELDVDIPARFCEDGFTTPISTGQPYPVRYDDEYTVQYIGIPIEGKLFFSDTYQNLYAKVGMDAMALVKDKLWLAEIFADHDCKRAHRLELNDFIYHTNIGIGYEFILSEKLNLLVEPTFGFMLNKLFKQPENSVSNITASVKNNIRVFDFGLMVGVKF